MGVISSFKRAVKAWNEPQGGLVLVQKAEPAIKASISTPAGTAQIFTDINDPRFLEFIRHGKEYGQDFLADRRLRNMAVLRCATLISEAIGMLPINLLATDKTKAVQSTDPAHRLMNLKPNTWQTPYEVKAQITIHAILDGNGYGRVIRHPGNGRPLAIVPLNRFSTMPRMLPGYQLIYDHVTPWGESIQLQAQDVLHLRDLTLDGIHGLSRLRLGCNALELAEMTEKSTHRLFKSGVMAGGTIEVPNALSDNAYARMKESIAEDHSGAENTGSMMILEEGTKANMFSSTGLSAQQLENRNHQIEEVARMFGVPRPLLMMDDTSWGSGVQQLALFFIQYGLAHWFKCWEEALGRCMISDARLGLVGFKFDESALLRGTLSDQATFFSKALGAGGSSPFLTQNEVRDWLDMPESDDPVASALRNPMTQPTNQKTVDGKPTGTDGDAEPEQNPQPAGQKANQKGRK